MTVDTFATGPMWAGVIVFARAALPGRLRHRDAAVLGRPGRAHRRAAGHAAYASAHHVAAPAAMRLAVPQANRSLSIAAAPGITFPFNLLVDIPLYHRLAQQAVQ